MNPMIGERAACSGARAGQRESDEEMCRMNADELESHARRARASNHARHAQRR